MVLGHEIMEILDTIAKDNRDFFSTLWLQSGLKIGYNKLKSSDGWIFDKNRKKFVTAERVL